MGSNPTCMGQLTFSLKKRESEPSQVVLLCCLALFIVSQLCCYTCELVAPLGMSSGILSNG